MQAQVVAPAFHIRRGERHVQRVAQNAQVLEINLLLEIFRAGGDQDTLPAEDRWSEIRERLAGSSAGLDEQHAAVFQRVGDRFGHLPLGRPAFERGQQSGKRPRVREDLGDALAQASYNGNVRHSFSTSTFTIWSAASSVGVASARAMSSPIVSISRSPMPRVVTAGVPMRMPLAVIGGLGSNGMAFLFTVMPALPSAASAALPVRPRENTSTSIRWLSVPPLTRRNPPPTSTDASRFAFATICLW